MADFLRFMSDIQLDNAKFIYLFLKKEVGPVSPLLV